MINALHKTAEDSVQGIMALINIILRSISGKDNSIPKILIIAPPVIGKLSSFMELFYRGKEEESKKISSCYKILSDAAGCTFIDSADFVKASDPDGIHLDIESQKILGLEVAKKVKELNL